MNKGGAGGGREPNPCPACKDPLILDVSEGILDVAQVILDRPTRKAGKRLTDDDICLSTQLWSCGVVEVNGTSFINQSSGFVYCAV